MSALREGVYSFFRFARLRHGIWEKRQNGQPYPWTDDPVLSNFRFCNIYRELDTTTAWFRENLREPLRGHAEKVLCATVAFRWFNRVETVEPLVSMLHWGWNPREAKARILEARGSGPYVTGAYVIKTPDGMTKLDGVLKCITDVLAQSDRILEAFERPSQLSLEYMWNTLRGYPYLGDFMAYEVVTDLRHTCLGEDAPDVDTWANPGPGACRGLARVQGLPIDTYDRHSAADREKVMLGMRELLWVSRIPKYWPEHWPRWELREVEHTLCEYDKYVRASSGEGRMKQVYRGPKP